MPFRQWEHHGCCSAVGALGEAAYTVTANVHRQAREQQFASHNVQSIPAAGVTLIRWRATILSTLRNRAWRKHQRPGGRVRRRRYGYRTLGGKTYTARAWEGNLELSVDVPAGRIFRPSVMAIYG
ncbi:hypothetical protein LAD67_08490 [Escherichia coli]|nr:hypothetical protein [Escherichia coli]